MDFYQKECLFKCVQYAKLGRCNCSDSIEYSPQLCRLYDTEARDCIKYVESNFLPERDCACPLECEYDYLYMQLEQSFWPSPNSLQSDDFVYYLHKLSTNLCSISNSCFLIELKETFTSFSLPQYNSWELVVELSEARDCIKYVESNFLPERDCACPPECEYDYLYMQLEQSFWPSPNSLPASFVQTYKDVNTSEGIQYMYDTIVPYLTEDKQESLSRFRQTFAKVNVYFSDLSLTTMEDTPSYTVSYSFPWLIWDCFI
ncbi:uncharacterized protein LOC142341322 [Convolutriloba macropyga]|uniref:uncharacterized protein LOC142341322 n=1 Tax=Convolutriloba macropyga TaxID=536237 RepID=UPI003F520A09